MDNITAAFLPLCIVTRHNIARHGSHAGLHSSLETMHLRSMVHYHVLSRERAIVVTRTAVAVVNRAPKRSLHGRMSAVVVSLEVGPTLEYLTVAVDVIAAEYKHLRDVGGLDGAYGSREAAWNHSAEVTA
jgi:hypothetical protein